MSEFTQEYAEKLGWRFVHSDPGSVTDLGDGNSKTIPASYVAEKIAGNHTLHEQGETVEKLIERIEWYENNQPKPEAEPEADES